MPSPIDDPNYGLRSAENLQRGIEDPKNPLNVSSLQGLNRTYGLSPFDQGQYRKDVSNVFGERKRGLATGAAGARRSLASRLGQQGSATPEFGFSAVDDSYLKSLGLLEGEQADANLAGLDKERQASQFNAGFLGNLVNTSTGRRIQGEQVKQGALNSGRDWLTNRENQPNTLDDILAVAGAAAPFLKFA
jgi:hypothetical protein